jgi:hypothetical protein
VIFFKPNLSFSTRPLPLWDIEFIALAAFNFREFSLSAELIPVILDEKFAFLDSGRSVARSLTPSLLKLSFFFGQYLYQQRKINLRYLN